MQILSVEIENFFCYVDVNLFEFESGLNIVSAKNSGGKSHLFNAFHWTFFNSIYVDRHGDTTKKEWKNADNVVTLPDNTIEKAEVGDILLTRTKILLKAEFHEDIDLTDGHVIYTFEKTHKFKKEQAGIFSIGRADLDISYVKDGETHFLSKGEYTWFLNKIFPVSIRKFMWFQGETVDELYDFSNPSTLNHAINEISYFPIYENLAKISNESVYSIGRKIDSELKKQQKFTKDQDKVIADIEYSRTKFTTLSDRIIDSEKQLQDIEQSILKEEDKLKGFEKYANLKSNLTKIEYEIRAVNEEINRLTISGKEKFIDKWMLNKCNHLVDASKNNLKLINDEIKNFQKNENPVPITLPGPEYVQKMLDDHICYICERVVEEETAPYFALKSRMEDFQNNAYHKLLIDNYTDLNRFKRNLLNELTNITEEFQSNENKINTLISQRKKLFKKRDNAYAESGLSSQDEIKAGSSTAEQILNKIRSLNNSKASLSKKIINLENEKHNIDNELKHLYEKKSKLITAEDSQKIPEAHAQQYIKMIDKALVFLKDKALEVLLKEITEESNLLYAKYLGGNTQGEIEIDKGVRVIDKVTKKQLSNLNTAELTAQKLAVANAFLSLSEKKMNRSFPLLADAPTSQFDDDNTLFLTRNLSDSFGQIIIMSKDYNALSSSERIDFIKTASVNRFYELENNLIDLSGSQSRSNKKTYIKKIK